MIQCCGCGKTYRVAQVRVVAMAPLSDVDQTPVRLTWDYCSPACQDAPPTRIWESAP